MKRGFTLIELLVVVLIVGILSAIALPQYQKAVDKARAVEALSTLNSLRQAIEVYILERGAFPSSFDELSIVPAGTLGTYEVTHDKVSGKYYDFILTEGRVDAGAETGWGVVWFSDYATNFTGLGKGRWCYVVDADRFSAENRKRGHDLCQSLSGQSSGIADDDAVFYALD